MKVTEVRIKLTGESDDRLLAFCSVTLDECFVVRDLKIIDGPTGPFVAMPSRKITRHCQRCQNKNHLRANYCSHCGLEQRAPESRGSKPRRSAQGKESGGIARDSGRESGSRLYADIAHPINSECREMIQSAVTREYFAELERSKRPGYRPRYDDEYNEVEPERTTDHRVNEGGDEPETDADEAAQSSISDSGNSVTHRFDPAEKKPGIPYNSKVTRPDAVESSPRKSSDKGNPIQDDDQIESGESSKPDDGNDQFGAGILD